MKPLPASDEVSLFVAVYDPSTGKTEAFEPFALTDAKNAADRLADLQAKYASRNEVEVTLISGTLKDLRNTHKRYFVNTAERMGTTSLVARQRRVRNPPLG